MSSSIVGADCTYYCFNWKPHSLPHLLQTKVSVASHPHLSQEQSAAIAASLGRRTPSSLCFQVNKQWSLILLCRGDRARPLLLPLVAMLLPPLPQSKDAAISCPPLLEIQRRDTAASLSGRNSSQLCCQAKQQCPHILFLNMDQVW